MTATTHGKSPEPLVAAFAERVSPAAHEPTGTAAPRSLGVDFATLKIFSDSPGTEGAARAGSAHDELPKKQEPAAPADEGEKPAGDVAPRGAPRRGRKSSQKRPPQR